MINIKTIYNNYKINDDFFNNLDLYKNKYYDETFKTNNLISDDENKIFNIIENITYKKHKKDKNYKIINEFKLKLDFLKDYNKEYKYNFLKTSINININILYFLKSFLMFDITTTETNKIKDLIEIYKNNNYDNLEALNFIKLDIYKYEEEEKEIYLISICFSNEENFNKLIILENSKINDDIKFKFDKFNKFLNIIKNNRSLYNYQEEFLNASLYTIYKNGSKNPFNMSYNELFIFFNLA